MAILYDQHGQPFQLGASANHMSIPQVRGGPGDWVESSDLYRIEQRTSPGMRFHVDRTLEQRASWIAFFTNGLVEGITNLLSYYTVGDTFAYGEIDDRDAQLAIDEFYSLNDLSLKAQRIWLEYLLSGESALLHETDASPDEPAYFGIFDLDDTFTLKSNTLQGPYRFEVPQRNGEPNRLWEEGEFVWTAHHALKNDPRGWPVMAKVVPAALSYVGLINARLRLQDIQGRINGIYKMLFNPGDPDFNKKIEARSRKFEYIPEDGTILTLAKNMITGEAEELDFTSGPSGAADAAEDGRMLRMLAAVALNIPPTWLGDGEDANRASAGVMNGPPLVAMRGRQTVFRSIMNRLFRNELRRRFGEDKRYTVRYTSRKRNDPLTIVNRRKQVPVDLLEFPFVLPNLSPDTLDEIINKVKTMDELNLASTITLQEAFELDPAIEKERMAAEGRTPGRQATPVTPTTPTPPVAPQPQPETEGTQPETTEGENDDG